MVIIAVIFLVASWLFGYLLFSRFFPDFKGLLRIAAAYVVGTLISVWFVFLLSVVLSFLTDQGITVAFILTTVFLAAVVAYKRDLLKIPLDLKVPHVAFFSILLIFSWQLFSSTVDYDSNLYEIKIGRFIWSDYGFHIPLIRSFSLGNNLSLEHPLFAHERVRYHFLFDFAVGSLEKMGLPIDFALTILSALLLTSLLVLIYYLAKGIFFGSRFVGIVSVILFLLNSSLSFVEFIRKTESDSLGSLVKSWWNLRDYVAFGPWDGNIIAAFWNWNIYTNQRQLIFGFALVAVVLNCLIHLHFTKRTEKKDTYGQKAFIGLMAGLLPLWNGPSFICLFGLLCLFFLFFPGRKESIIVVGVALIIALPQILWLQKSSPNPGGHISLSIGYLAVNHLVPAAYTPFQLLNRGLSAVITFIRYWFFNLGLSVVTISVSFLLLDTKRKKIFLMFLTLFLLGNLVRFGPEIAANHKFFNLWILLSNIFSAYLLYRLYHLGWIGRGITVFLLFLLTISGVVDIPPIKNDFTVNYSDYKKQPTAKWIVENTDPDDVFLTTTRIYSPVSFTGRRAMVGWPYFAWSAGLDQRKRERLVRKIFETNSKAQLCNLLRINKIDYILTEKQPEKNPKFKINHQFFNENFKPVFFDLHSNYKETIFATEDMCSGND